MSNVEPVIDSKLFLMVQDRLSENKAIAVNTKPSKHLKELSGLLKCPNCGSAVKYSNNYFVCSGRHQKKICNVSYAGVKLDDVRLLVDEEIQKYLDNFESYKLKKHKQKEKIQNTIKSLEVQRANLIKMASYSANVEDAVMSELDKVQSEIYELQLKQKFNVDRHDVIEARLNLKTVFELMNNNSFSYITDEAKQTVLLALVDRIELDASGKIKIIYKDLI